MTADTLQILIAIASIASAIVNTCVWVKIAKIEVTLQYQDQEIKTLKGALA